MGVVEAFDVVEDGGSGLVPGGEAVPVQEFGFEGGEERFGYGHGRRRGGAKTRFPKAALPGLSTWT